MKCLLLLFSFVVLFAAGCTHKIVRKGYTPAQASQGYCAPDITKTLATTDSLKKVGEIELKDGGFATKCSEEHALTILRKEACAADAQLIHITEERRADFSSSCYRCKATLYQNFSVSRPTVVSPEFRQENVEERVRTDRRNATAQVIAVTIGIVLGVFVATVISR